MECHADVIAWDSGRARTLPSNRRPRIGCIVTISLTIFLTPSSAKSCETQSERSGGLSLVTHSWVINQSHQKQTASTRPTCVLAFEWCELAFEWCELAFEWCELALPSMSRKTFAFESATSDDQDLSESSNYWLYRFAVVSGREIYT